MTKPRHLILNLLALLALLPSLAVSAEQQPIEVLREHVTAGIEVLKAPPDYTEVDGSQPSNQARLCAITHNMFDIYAFSRLVLAAHWKHFDADQRTEFVDVFGDFLCHYYIGRLQAGYSNETVNFVGQEFKSETRAVVTVEVLWQNVTVPIEVRMVRRNKQWKAYDIAIAGISGVMIYRAQFSAELANQSPAEVIAELRRRIAEKA